MTTVFNTPPQISVTAPIGNVVSAEGDTIGLQATATDLVALPRACCSFTCGEVGDCTGDIQS